MRIHRETHTQAVDLTSLTGMVLGMGLLFSAVLAGDLDFLAIPAFGVLVPSLLYGLR